MKPKNKVILFTGIVLALIGLLFPVPGPADDPVDFIGYFLIIISATSTFVKGKSTELPGTTSKTKEIEKDKN